MIHAVNGNCDDCLVCVVMHSITTQLLHLSKLDFLLVVALINSVIYYYDTVFW